MRGVGFRSTHPLPCPLNRDTRLHVGIGHAWAALATTPGFIMEIKPSVAGEHDVSVRPCRQMLLWSSGIGVVLQSAGAIVAIVAGSNPVADTLVFRNQLTRVEPYHP